MSSAASTVVLIDDHELIRAGLRRALEQIASVTVVADVDGVQSGRDAVHKHAPDVVVVDVRLKDGHGLDLVRDLRAEQPRLGLVVLTMYAGDAVLLDALRAGASALVSKDEPIDRVVAAIHHAFAAPNTFIAADLAGALSRRATTPEETFSAAERSLLEMLAAGHAIGRIARTLTLGESTVKAQVSRLYAKLGAANRAQAVLLAVRAGALDPTDGPK